jgi:hypothetical protein
LQPGPCQHARGHVEELLLFGEKLGKKQQSNSTGERFRSILDLRLRRNKLVTDALPLEEISGICDGEHLPQQARETMSPVHRQECVDQFGKVVHREPA